jgi:hypothetical protein
VRFIGPRARTHRNERHPVFSGHGATRRLGIDAQEAALPDRNLVTVDSPTPRAPDDHVHLFLSGSGFVMLHPHCPWTQLKPVDAKRLDANLPPHETHRAARPSASDVINVDHGVRHRAIVAIDAQSTV